MQGILGKKVGMTRLFDKETGESIPVTVIEAATNVIHQIKTVEKDGYRAVQVGFDILPDNRVNKPLAGHFKKHGSVPTRVVREVAFDSADESLEEGQKIGVEILENVAYVDVIGTSKGRGYAGEIKRHNQHRGRETHGSKSHREHGSHGPATYPARVFPGLKMSGQYGNSQVTVKGLKVVGFEKENGLVYLKGAVPGANRRIVFLRKSTTNKK